MFIKILVAYSSRSRWCDDACQNYFDWSQKIHENLNSQFWNWLLDPMGKSSIELVFHYFVKLDFKSIVD